MPTSFAAVVGLTGVAIITLSSQLALASRANAGALNISADATQNMSCTGGVCTPTGTPAVLNVTDLQNMLAGSDVAVKSNQRAMDIEVANSLSWASSHLLSLDSYRGITFDRPVTVEGTAGLTLVTNDGGNHGDFSFLGTDAGNITFWDLASKLTINGKRYTLVNDLTTLAAAVYHKPNGRYALANDYSAIADGTYTDSPIATDLAGTFEGLGHDISNLRINASNVDNPAHTIGLFVSARTLRDIYLTEASVIATADADGSGAGFCIGLLVGKTDVGSTIRNVTVGQGYVLAQRGAAQGFISAQIGALTCGGEGTITNVAVAGGVNVNDFDSAFVGGLVGIKEVGEITNARAFDDLTVHVLATNSPGGDAVVGGLVGLNNGTISSAYATGNILADGQPQNGGVSVQAGGLVGVYNGSDNSIANVYATGSVNGTSAGANAVARIGGLVGFYDTGGSEENTRIADAYSTGKVSGSGPGQCPPPDGGACLAGLVGDVNDPGEIVVDTYWDLDTSNITDPSQGVRSVPYFPGVTGKTTKQLQKGLPKGFKSSVWALDANKNGGFPYLMANPPR